MNGEVDIGGVKIRNHDFILGDSDGVVVVPEARWPEVIDEAWKRIGQEWTIKMQIALGLPPEQILKQTGPF